MTSCHVSINLFKYSISSLSDYRIELKGISDWLDENLELLDWVEADVKNRNVAETGRKGLPIESVLRCAILKQYRQLSFEELVFCLMDSASCQAFSDIRRRIKEQVE